MNSGAARDMSFPDGSLRLTPLADGRRRLDIRLADPAAFCTVRTWDTRYPDAVIEAVVRTKGLAWTCDEIMRDEDPTRVEHILRHALFRYLPEDALNGQRLLDFGCGSGASSMILARLFPEAHIVGLELSDDLRALAEVRRAYYGHARMRIVPAAGADRLPADLPRFDAIILNAVFEHMRPLERRRLLPALWERLDPGGWLFICETPYRWSTFEWHTTGLPLLNFLPDRWCRRVACRESVRVLPTESWQDLLRMGIRGGSVREVVAILNGAGAKPEVLTPARLGITRAIDRWDVSPHGLFATLREPDRGNRWRLALVRRLEWLVRHVTGLSAGASIALALRKPEA